MVNQISLGPTGQRVAENVWKIREARGYTKTELAQRTVHEVGRSMSLNVLTLLEAGQRRVDADDLVSLALALRCSPNRLLLPGQASNDEVALTAHVIPLAWQAWRWACGESPLALTGEGLSAWDDYVRFPRENRPHRGAGYTREQAQANAHLLDPIRDAVTRAIEAGVPPTAAVDCAEQVVMERSITASLREHQFRAVTDEAPATDTVTAEVQRFAVHPGGPPVARPKKADPHGS
jgi:transcriptional regulator with XRE-family HTH domain